MSKNSTTRFADRVDLYIKFRPGYPAETLSLLSREVGLSPSSAIADAGSGTGILSEIFLRNGNPVFGIEPNPEMRLAAESLLSQYDNFVSIDGTAENTGIAAGSIDLITAAQAFHWFDVDKTRAEFRRILKPQGFVALLWNDRRTDTTEFLKGYEKLLLDFSLDYQQVNHRNVSDEQLTRFFGAGGFQKFELCNYQLFDYEGLEGRLLSSSYAPMAGHPNHEPMLQRLREIVDQHQVNGQVSFDYDTQIFLGQISD